MGHVQVRTTNRLLKVMVLFGAIKRVETIISAFVANFFCGNNGHLLLHW